MNKIKYYYLLLPEEMKRDIQKMARIVDDSPENVFEFLLDEAFENLN